MDYISILAEFFKMHEYLAYLILFLGSYFETLIGPGFFIHGEFFFLPGSIIAGLGYLNVWLVYLTCVVGGILGDHSSYIIGKKYGKKMISFLFKKENKYLTLQNLMKAEKFCEKFGAKSLFYARLLGPISWVAPFIAGILRISYRKFVKYNTLGVAVGIGQFIALGYLLGFAYLKIFDLINRFFLLFLIAIILIAVSGYYITRKIHLITLIRKKAMKIFLKHGITIMISYVILQITVIYLIFTF